MRSFKWVYFLAFLSLLAVSCGGGDDEVIYLDPIEDTSYDYDDDTVRYHKSDMQEITSEYQSVPASSAGKTAYLISYNMSGTSISDYAKCGGGILTRAESGIQYSIRQTGSFGIAAPVLSTASSCGELAAVCASCASEAEADPYKTIRLMERNAAKRAGQALRCNGRITAASRSADKFSPCSAGDTQDAWVIPGYALLSGNDEQVKKPFTLMVSGRLCNVWLCNDGCAVDSGALMSIAEAFDSVFDTEMKVFGQRTMNNATGIYINTPEKINIFIYDFYGRTSSSQSRAEAFFFSTDLYTSRALAAGEETNETQCFYIDSRMISDDNWAISSLVHEGQHMLGFIAKTVNSSSSYDTWHTEMLSVMAQDILSSYIGTNDLYRAYGYYIEAFNNCTWDGFYDWNGTLSSYGAAYVFVSYLSRQYGGGRPVSFVRELAQNNAGGKASVTQALHTFGYTNETFEDAIEGFGWYILNCSFGAARENVLGMPFIMNPMRCGISILQNPPDRNSVIAMPLGAYAFFVVNLGKTKAGDMIRVRASNTAPSIKMFVCYK